MATRDTFCPRCGRDDHKGTELNDHNRKYRCPGCGAIHYGLPAVIGPCRACQRCELVYAEDTWTIEPIMPWESLPSKDTCPGCQEDIANMAATVVAGGIYWRCSACGGAGTFPADHDISIKVRKKMSADKPEMIGVDLDKDTCPVCTGHCEIPDIP
jgi:rubredoxin